MSSRTHGLTRSGLALVALVGLVIGAGPRVPLFAQMPAAPRSDAWGQGVSSPRPFPEAPRSLDDPTARALSQADGNPYGLAPIQPMAGDDDRTSSRRTARLPGGTSGSVPGSILPPEMDPSRSRSGEPGALPSGGVSAIPLDAAPTGPRMTPSSTPSNLTSGRSASGPSSQPSAVPLASPLPGRDGSGSGPDGRAMTGPAGTSGPIVSSGPSTLIDHVGADIRVSFVGPQAVVLGLPTEFRVQAKNAGSRPAREVVVRVSLPRRVEVLTPKTMAGTVETIPVDDTMAELRWKIPGLLPSQDASLTFSLRATPGQPLDLALDWVEMAEQVRTTLTIQEPKLDLAIAGPTEVIFGQKPKYTITVSNPGTGDASDVRLALAPLDDPGGQPLIKALGILGAGQSRTIEIEFEPSTAGRTEIQAAAVGAPNLQVEANQTVLVRRANVELSLDGPEMLYAGTTADYTFTFANVGDAPAESIVAAVVLPEGMTYLSGLTGVSQEGGGLKLSLGTLPPGQTRQAKMTVEVRQAGRHQLQAGARWGDGGVVRQAIDLTVDAVADLKLVINDPRGPKPTGQDVEYELQILNRGLTAAENVLVTTQFSDGIEPVRAEGHPANVESGQVTFHPLRQVPAGGEVKLKVVARADKSGHHVFRAQVVSDDSDIRLVSEVTTLFFGPDRTSGSPRQAARPGLDASAPPSSQPTMPPAGTPSSASPAWAPGSTSSEFTPPASRSASVPAGAMPSSSMPTGSMPSNPMPSSSPSIGSPSTGSMWNTPAPPTVPLPPPRTASKPIGPTPSSTGSPGSIGGGSAPGGSASSFAPPSELSKPPSGAFEPTGGSFQPLPTFR